MVMRMDEDDFETEDNLLFALQDTAKPGSPWPWITILIVGVALWWLMRPH